MTCMYICIMSGTAWICQISSLLSNISTSEKQKILILHGTADGKWQAQFACITQQKSHYKHISYILQRKLGFWPEGAMPTQLKYRVTFCAFIFCPAMWLVLSIQVSCQHALAEGSVQSFLLKLSHAPTVGGRMNIS